MRIHHDPLAGSTALGLLVSGFIAAGWGARKMVLAKGYSPSMTWVGLIPVLGPLALLLLPDRHPDVIQRGFEPIIDTRITMRITIRLFAILRERAGIPELAIDLPQGATVAQACEALASRYPQLTHHSTSTAYAVNRAYAPLTAVLKDGDELAIIPPVSGG